jgi:hypothetical protein
MRQIGLLTDERSVPYWGAFRAGVFGALIVAGLMGLARATGITPLSLEIALGSLLTRESAQTAGGFTFLVGFVMHLVAGGCFAMAYAAIFRSWNRSSSGRGASLGLAHWLLAGVVMGFLEPGFFAAGFGAASVFMFFIVHVVFGAVVGGLYRAHAIDNRAKLQLRSLKTRTAQT